MNLRDGSTDVAILGGGPAGLAAAIALAREGRAVVVLERSNFMVERIGDTLSPEAFPWLARLDVLQDVAAVPAIASTGVISLWRSWPPEESDSLFHPYGSGRHVDRSCFDATLAAAAERHGAKLLLRFEPRECRRDEQGWRIGGTHGGQPVTIQTPWVVDASGRSGWFLRRQGVPRVTVDHLVAVVARTSRADDFDPRLAIEAAPDGWWYYAPLPAGQAIVSFLTDADLLPARRDLPEIWRSALRSTRVISQRVANDERHSPLRIVPAEFSYASAVTGDHWLATGDAAHAHDPLSGRGIAAALASGCEAASALVAAANGEADAWTAYQQTRRRHVDSERIERLDTYSRVTRWADRTFWRRRTGG